MISSAAIGGYALEEVIARMLSDNGYQLILSAAHDHSRLVAGKHGLLVRGRGADHQADGLGDLLVPVPFSDPVRLFAEAKNRVSRTGIDAVRNALGVLSDVNQFQPAFATGPSWSRRGYHYRYSLFSTSGFTPLAQSFALAHQISLIDLSGSSFSALRRAVEQFALAARELCVREGLASFPIGQMRAALRLALGTAGYTVPLEESAASRLVEELDPSTSESGRMPSAALLSLASSLSSSALGDMVLGFPVGPFVFVLRPDDAEQFGGWVASAPNRAIARVRSTASGPDGDWVLILDDAPGERPVVLRFSTPDAVTDWLLSSSSRVDARLSDLEVGLLSALTIYRAGRSITLELDLGWGEDEATEAWTADERMALRRRKRFDERLATSERTVRAEWTEDAAWQLAEALLREDPGRTSVLFAALDDVSGWVPRDMVYRLMAYEPGRSLRKFTAPYSRHRDVLIEEGLLGHGAPAPLTAEYHEPGGWAAGFRLDQGFAQALRSSRGGSQEQDSM